MNTEIVDNIRKAVDIVDIISRYVSLVPKGKNYWGVCPFHDDHSPSMSVSKEKQIYTCFSCGASGNVFNFIEDFENVSFREALKILGDIAGIPVDGIKIKNNNNINKNLYDIYDISIKFYTNNLNTNYGIKAREYLKNRGIDDQLIKTFQIGLSLPKRDMLTRLLVKKGFSNKDMVDSGLIIKSDYGYSDIYHNRIIFPLCDVSGNIVGYSGRIYNGEDESKYINTKETAIFKKGELLYNYHRAKEECRKTNTVIITEGFMDVIRCHSVGILNVVATMGTAFTKKHIMLIRKLAKNVILMFDGDSAGAKATESCSNLLMEYNITPKIVRLEENLDPDEYVLKYGKEQLIQKLENPINIMDFKLMNLKNNRDLNNSTDKANYVKDVFTELKKIDDDILREVSLNKLSEDVGLNIEFLKEKLDYKKNNQTTYQTIKPIIKQEKNKSKYDKAQMYLIYYMLKSDKVIKMYDEKVTYMPNEKYRRLATYISCFYKDKGYIYIADLMTYLSQFEGTKEIIGEILNLNLKDDYTISEINDYIYTIKEYSLRDEIKRLKKEQEKEIESFKKAEIGMKILELKKMEQEERYYDKWNKNFWRKKKRSS